MGKPALFRCNYALYAEGSTSRHIVMVWGTPEPHYVLQANVPEWDFATEWGLGRWQVKHVGEQEFGVGARVQLDAFVEEVLEDAGLATLEASLAAAIVRDELAGTLQAFLARFPAIGRRPRTRLPVDTFAAAHAFLETRAFELSSATGAPRRVISASLARASHAVMRARSDSRPFGQSFYPGVTKYGKAL